MDNKTSIQISRELQKTLASFGKKGETYEDIIRRLINGKVDLFIFEDEKASSKRKG
jgi:hypothetical protein